MKIDVSKIEGFEEMTPEQKVEALTNLEIETPDGDAAKYKNLLNKANAEAAE